MTTAFANARMHAWKSRLLARGDAMPLFTASNAQEMDRAVAALGVTDPMARLMRIYDVAIAGYPHGAPLFRALRGLHEIEDVTARWRRGERPSDDAFRAIVRAHADDPAAAELAFDRLASQRVRDAARKLPPRETLARRLAESVIEEREAQLVLRGAKWYGLTTIASKPVDIVKLRRERLRLCRRAFTGSPFLLAPAVAVVLLAEEEVRAVRALVERQGDERLDAAMTRALAASQIGA